MPSTPSSAPPEPDRPGTGPNAARGRRRPVAVLLGLVVLLGLGTATAVLVGADDDPPDASTRDRTSPSSCRARVADGPLELDAPAPAFRLPGLDGGCVDLAAFRGQPVVLNFWASWCNPCRREFPLLRSALDSHANADLAVIGIVYRDIASDARGFAGEFGATWDLALDDDADAAGAYGVRAIPQTFFIRRDGTVARRVYGLTTARALEQHLDEIL